MSQPSDELTDQFFQISYALPCESEIIISDNDVFHELNLTEFINDLKNKPNKYIDVDMEQIMIIVSIYFKRLFNKEDHIMIYDHKQIYSYYDCVEYIKRYKCHLDHQVQNYNLFLNDSYYRHVYLNITTLNDILFIKPKNFNVFKKFINDYYDYIINKLKLTIKYLQYNIQLYTEPLVLKYFKSNELLSILTEVNEALSNKIIFTLFREYGIPVKLIHKINLISNLLLSNYTSKNHNEFIIDINILLIEYYKYEYSFYLFHSINSIKQSTLNHVFMISN